MSNPIQPGNLVRSYDFPDRLLFDDDGRVIEADPLVGPAACYVEGVVVCLLPVGAAFRLPTGDHFQAPDCDRIIIRVIRRMWEGEELDLAAELGGRFVFPPVNGTPTLMGSTTHGVVNLDEPQRPKLIVDNEAGG